MKGVALVLLVCSALCNGAYLDYDEVYENYIDENKDATSLLGKCTKTGSKCNYSTVLSSVTKIQLDLCKMAIDLACSEAQEPVRCTAGQKAAKANGNCDILDSDASKNCCLACKIGRLIKRETGECADDFSDLSPASRVVASKCCKDDADTDYYVDFNYETNAVDTRLGKEDAGAPAETVGRRCSDLNPCTDKQLCVDSLTGPKCECKVGYEETEIGGCRDIDECISGAHNCTKLNRQCKNVEGSFKCSKCTRGFKSRQSYYSDEGDDVCVDIDECSSGTCRESEKCTNLIGSHRCSNTKCPAKYKKHGEHHCVWKNCDLARSKICHKTFAFVFKTVSPSDRTNEILKFYATSYTGTFDKDLFEVINVKTNNFVLKQRKPLQRDESFQLVIRIGRKEHIKDVSVFRSDY